MLVSCIAANHLKMEPYIRYSLDQLDFVLLGCLVIIALSSLVFQLEGSDDSSNPFFSAWSWLINVSVALSLATAVATVVLEIRVRLLKLYVQKRQKMRRVAAKVRRVKTTIQARASTIARLPGLENKDRSTDGSSDRSNEDIEFLQSLRARALQAVLSSDEEVMDLLFKVHRCATLLLATSPLYAAP